MNINDYHAYESTMGKDNYSGGGSSGCMPSLFKFFFYIYAFPAIVTELKKAGITFSGVVGISLVIFAFYIPFKLNT